MSDFEIYTGGEPKRYPWDGVGSTRQDHEFPVESMMRMYPYGNAMGSDVEPITLFHGDDYGEEWEMVQVGGLFSTLKKAVSAPFKPVSKFVGNAVKAAGKEVGKATKTVQNVAGQIGKGIGKIPIVGSPLKTVFDAGFHIGMAPVNLTVAVVIEGKRIDKAVLSNLKGQLQQFKQVAPYAQMVISVVPGIGQGVSGALSAGLALAEGQSIDEVLKAGAIGAMPGGPIVKAAVTMGVETIQQVAKGGPVNLQTLSKTAAGTATSALGLPIAASNAIVAGVATIGAVANGKALDKALVDNAAQGLPISVQAKKAMTDASTIALDLSRGKKLDAGTITRLNVISTQLPTTNPLRDSIRTGLEVAKKAGKDKEKAMSVALQSGLADTLTSMGAQTLPTDVQKGIKAGVALGSGRIIQNQRGKALIKVTGKLSESGLQVSRASPVFAEARKIVGPTRGVKGFDIGVGLTQQQIGVFDVATVRNSLKTPADKMGFDIALSTKIGVVANPKPPNVSAAAHAGNAITLGMQGYTPERKMAIMKAIEVSPSATVGATVAVKQVATKRDNWIARVLKALGLRR